MANIPALTVRQTVQIPASVGTRDSAVHGQDGETTGVSPKSSIRHRGEIAVHGAAWEMRVQVCTTPASALPLLRSGGYHIL